MNSGLHSLWATSDLGHVGLQVLFSNDILEERKVTSQSMNMHMFFARRSQEEMDLRIDGQFHPWLGLMTLRRPTQLVADDYSEATSSFETRVSRSTFDHELAHYWNFVSTPAGLYFHHLERVKYGAILTAFTETRVVGQPFLKWIEFLRESDLPRDPMHERAVTMFTGLSQAVRVEFGTEAAPLWFAADHHRRSSELIQANLLYEPAGARYDIRPLTLEHSGNSSALPHPDLDVISLCEGYAMVWEAWLAADRGSFHGNYREYLTCALRALPRRYRAALDLILSVTGDVPAPVILVILDVAYQGTMDVWYRPPELLPPQTFESTHPSWRLSKLLWCLESGVTVPNTSNLDLLRDFATSLSRIMGWASGSGLSAYFLSLGPLRDVGTDKQLAKLGSRSPVKIVDMLGRDFAIQHRTACEQRMRQGGLFIPGAGELEQSHLLPFGVFSEKDYLQFRKIPDFQAALFDLGLGPEFTARDCSGIALLQSFSISFVDDLLWAADFSRTEQLLRYYVSSEGISDSSKVDESVAKFMDHLFAEIFPNRPHIIREFNRHS